MMLSSLSLLLLPLAANTTPNHEEIERAVLDYAESYYEVRPDYVERSIHPELAKIGYTWREGQWSTHPMDYDGFVKMVAWLQSQEDKPAPGPKEVVILDAMDQTALVQLTGSWGIDYMQLARFDGRWQTRHVVWQTVPIDPSEEAIEADRAAVARAAQDYLDGLYQARPELVEKSVHAELAKLGFTRKEPGEAYEPSVMTRAELLAIAGTWNAEGDKVDADTPGKVEVLGVMDRVACVKLTALWGADYMHLTKDEDGVWKIRHILWQTLPPRASNG